SYNYNLNTAPQTTTWKVDGATATLAQFDSALSIGDEVVYSRNNSAQAFALTNKVPAAITGTLTEPHSPHTATVVNGPDRIAFNYSAATKFIVDGTSSTENQLEAKLSAGDTLTF